MWSGVVVEGEPGGEVLAEQLGLLDVGEQGGVHGFLRGLVLGLSLLVGLLLLLGEVPLAALEVLLGHLALGGFSAEVGVVDVGDVDSVQGHRGGGGDHVGGVHSSERHAVEFVGAGDKEKTRSQLLEEDHSLAPELAGQQDEHLACGEGLGLRAGSGNVPLALEVLLDVVGGVPGVSSVGELSLWGSTEREMGDRGQVGSGLEVDGGGSHVSGEFVGELGLVGGDLLLLGDLAVLIVSHF